MSTRRWLSATLLAVASTLCPAADTKVSVPAKKMDAYFDALANHQLANGSIAISERGVLKYQRAVGFARIANGKQEPTETATRYRIGSVSGLFTAVLVMQLVEGASITLDSKLAEFYPDLPNALDITYRDLLQHRSGLADYTGVANFQTWRTTPKTHAQILQIITTAGAKFPPRERVEYNNSNYLLLGYVLEKIYERSYDEILQRQISAKLGMSRTYYAGGGIASLESISYQLTPGGWVALTPTDPSIHGGADGLISTPAELVQFIDALFATKIVTAHSLANMRDQDGGSGMGLWPYEVAGQKGYGHGGNIEGFRSCVYHFPDSGISISYATNASVLSMDEIVDEALALIFERGRKPPTFEPAKLTTAQQAAYVGEWRSAGGLPQQTAFRQFRPPDQPIQLAVKAGTDAPIVTLQNRDFQLTALGGHEFELREIGYFLRFDPRADELVIRGPDWSYFLKRAR
ncbi:MAG: serine hydrolase domain-containing protein [Pseudomonadota bacterium]